MMDTVTTRLTPTRELVLEEVVPRERHRNKVFWKQGYFFLNDEKRIATVTDVKFVAPDRVVVAHRAAAKLYLVRLLEQGFHILHSLELDTARFSLRPGKRRARRRFFHPDLIGLHGDLIYMSEFTNRCGVVRVTDRKLAYRNVIGLGDTPFHGCFCDGKEALFGAIRGGCITTLNYASGAIGTLKTDLALDLRIKTIYRHGDNLLLSVDKKLGNNTRAGSTVQSWVNLYAQHGDELRLKHSLPIPNGQIDGHRYYDGHHFVTMHDSQLRAGVIVVLKVENDRIRVVRKVVCEAFPHGLDIRDDCLIYSSYGRSSVIIHSLDELLS